MILIDAINRNANSVLLSVSLVRQTGANQRPVGDSPNLLSAFISLNPFKPLPLRCAHRSIVGAPLRTKRNEDLTRTEKSLLIMLAAQDNEKSGTHFDYSSGVFCFYFDFCFSVSFHSADSAFARNVFEDVHIITFY